MFVPKQTEQHKHCTRMLRSTSKTYAKQLQY